MILIHGITVNYNERGINKYWTNNSSFVVDDFLRFLIDNGVYDSIKVERNFSVEKAVMDRMLNRKPEKEI